MPPKLVETAIEPITKIPAGASCFVEREGARLIVKIWLHGQLQETRPVRATGLPVGEYRVVDGKIIHRHDPATVLAELARHQRRVRMQSPEFRAVAKQIAKQLGGSLGTWENDEGVLLGYRIKRKKRELETAVLDRVMRDFAVESVIVFRAGTDGEEIGLCIGERALELLPVFCDHWDEDVEKLVRKVETECGVTVVGLRDDLIHLKLGKKPKDPKSFLRMFDRLAEETGLEYEGREEGLQMLEQRELFLWWD